MKKKKVPLEIKDQNSQQHMTTILNKKRLLILTKYLKWYGVIFGIVFIVSLTISYIFSSQLDTLRSQLQGNIITIDTFVNTLVSYSLAVVAIFAGFEIILAIQGGIIYKHSSNTISNSETLKMSWAIIIVGHAVKALWNIVVVLYLYTLPIQSLKQSIQNAINTGSTITAEMIYPSQLLTLNSFLGLIGLLGYMIFCFAFQRLSRGGIEFRRINTSLLLILIGGAILSVPSLALFGDILLGFGFLNLAKNLEFILSSTLEKKQ